MPRQDPVGEMKCLADRVKDVAIFFSDGLWDRGHDGSLWFHHIVIINIPPGSGNINTTIQNPDGEVVLVIVSRSGYLLDVEGG